MPVRYRRGGIWHLVKPCAASMYLQSSIQCAVKIIWLRATPRNSCQMRPGIALDNIISERWSRAAIFLISLNVCRERRRPATETLDNYLRAASTRDVKICAKVEPRRRVAPLACHRPRRLERESIFTCGGSAAATCCLRMPSSLGCRERAPVASVEEMKQHQAIYT